MDNLNIEYLNIDDLKPYEKNARLHTEKDLKTIIESIKAFGFNDPIGIWKDNVIVEGHGRLMAGKKLGLTKVPCIRLDHLTDEQRRAYALAHNKTAEMSDWDMGFLPDELSNITEFDMSAFGFDVPIFDEEIKAVEDDFDEELPEEPKTKLGDIYQLGKHRLMCGDSTKKENVEKLLNGTKIDMVFTDPPYDMDMGGKGCFAKSMDNCKDRIEDIIHFDPYVLSYLPTLDINSFYVFTSKNGIVKYLDIFKELNYDILCWCKTNPVPFTSGSFLPDVEYLLYFSRKGRVWNNSLKPTSTYKKYYVTQKLQGRIDGGGDLHPTMKPLEIIVDKIRINSREDGAVLDIFGGSGSTMIACEQTKRSCFMIELSPQYCDVIINRWEKFTGKKAELIK